MVSEKWERFIYWIVAAIIFLSAFFGYKGLATNIILAGIIGANPFYIRYKLKNNKASQQEASEMRMDDRWRIQLRKLKLRFYIYSIIMEILLIAILGYSALESSIFGYMSGIAVLLLVVYTFIVRLSLCPRCNHHYFRDEPKKSVVIGPGSIGFRYYPVRIATTSNCMNCGLSWNVMGSVTNGNH